MVSSSGRSSQQWPLQMAIISAALWRVTCRFFFFFFFFFSAATAAAVDCDYLGNGVEELTANAAARVSTAHASVLAFPWRFGRLASLQCLQNSRLRNYWRDIRMKRLVRGATVGLFSNIPQGASTVRRGSVDLFLRELELRRISNVSGAPRPWS